jgi:hypothetical protein
MVTAALLLVRRSFVALGNRWPIVVTLGAVSLVAEPLCAQPSELGTGVGVVLWGPVSESSSQLCKEVARTVYAQDGLAPRVDEASVRALCGAEDVSESAAAISLRDLRAALTSPIDGPATQVLLAAVAKQTNTRALLLVRVVEPPLGADTSATTEVLVVHRMPEGTSGPALFVDPLRFELAFPLPQASPTEVAQAARELVLSPPCSRAIEGEALAGPMCSLPERNQVALAPFEWWAPIPDAPAGKTGLIDSPWFWIAAGGVAALGLTVLVVSQTTDVSEGTVRIEGTVPR